MLHRPEYTHRSCACRYNRCCAYEHTCTCRCGASRNRKSSGNGETQIRALRNVACVIVCCRVGFELQSYWRNYCGALPLDRRTLEVLPGTPEVATGPGALREAIS